jgi:hypothetical protein
MKSPRRDAFCREFPRAERTTQKFPSVAERHRVKVNPSINAPGVREPPSER